MQTEGVFRLTYSVDLALCIDATGSMAPVIDMVKTNALGFHDDLTRAMAGKQKRIDHLRARVIVFRDLHEDGPDAIQASPFLDLPDRLRDLAAFLAPVRAAGGGDEPESGLEALALAMRSNWVRTGDRRRHVIVLWTDASSHALEVARRRGSPGYPSNLPASFADLTALWEGPAVDASAKRLLLYAPDAYPWNDIQSSWESVVHVLSRAGHGLQELDYAEVLDVIANSV